MSTSATAADTTNRLWWRLTPPLRKAVVVLHVVTSVALLGELWGLVMLNLTATLTTEVKLAHFAYRLMERLIFAGGAPLSITGLASGVVLALSSPWGLLRHNWVFVKLVLLVAVILTGMLLFTPGRPRGRHAERLTPDAVAVAAGALIAGGVAMLVVSTTLAVVKPRGRLPWSRRART